MTAAKIHLKNAIKIIINNNANPVSIAIHLGKGSILAIIDRCLPDEPDEPVQAK